MTWTLACLLALLCVTCFAAGVVTVLLVAELAARQVTKNSRVIAVEHPNCELKPRL